MFERNTEGSSLCLIEALTLIIIGEPLLRQPTREYAEELATKIFANYRSNNEEGIAAYQQAAAILIILAQQVQQRIDY